MTTSFDHTTFISPFTWRYGSQEMRHIWSELHKRALMRQVWVALARAQREADLVTAGQLADLVAHEGDVDIERSAELERETRHDVVAELRAFAEQCPVGGRILHWGATSADITDNVDVLRMREATKLLAQELGVVLRQLASHIERTAAQPVLAYTHIQPAEPTTLGYRLAVYAQDLLNDHARLQGMVAILRGKGFKGAVGTQASFEEILRDSTMSPLELEARAMSHLELPYYRIATQTYTRQQDLHVLQALAGIAASLHKFALDFRLLQSPAFGEWAEPFGSGQVGSSAMPFKRNPINMENICSLTRYIAALPAVAWDNASQAILERSLDDSANRRLTLAGAFLATDEALRRVSRVLGQMTIDTAAMERNLSRYGSFSATERVLMRLVARGAHRQDAHEWLRELSLAAWQRLQQGEENPLLDLVVGDARIRQYLPEEESRSLMDARAHTGTAEARAREMAQEIQATLAPT